MPMRIYPDGESSNRAQMCVTQNTTLLVCVNARLVIHTAGAAPKEGP